MENLGLSLVVWIPIGIWIFFLVMWMIQGEIDFVFGSIGVVIGLALGVVAYNPPTGHDWVQPAVIAGVVFTMGAFVPIRNALQHHELLAIDAEAMERAYQQLEERPNNVGARMKIAKLVYNRGLQGHAIAIAEAALKGAPEETFGEEHKTVSYWKRMEHEDDGSEPLKCDECGAYNAPGEIFCKRCNSPFLLDYAKGRWMGRATARKLTAGWIALMGVFVGIPVAAALPPLAAVLLMIGIGILVLITLYAAFIGNTPRKGRQTSTRRV